MSGSSDFTNRLIKEKSPYLLQHAHNPVDWYPWGKEAFEKAREENKPIFLSVGYSTCHWCHVMEHESFENEQVAAVLNQDFISIKVDREERPDVDNVYMTFIQATSGHGGWPMSVFLTPHLQPFLGGTYFPPTDSFGRPGFITVLSSVALQWKMDSLKIKESGSKIIKAIGDAVTNQKGSSQLPNSNCCEKLYSQFRSRFDEDEGGFGSAPKFPQPVNLGFLLQFSKFSNEETKRKVALEMVERTLNKMMDGGIHDHVSQGFHRYSTDSEWHVPHFEKMLYDQGQLASVYADAYKVTGKQRYLDAVNDILLYVSRDLSHKDGGFFSVEDADSLPTKESSAKTEGAFCVWSAPELQSLLGELSPCNGTPSDTKLYDIFSFHYGVEEDGNVKHSQDPQGKLKNQNVLIIRHSIDDAAEHFGMSSQHVTEAIKKSNKILFDARLLRPRPHLDTKIVTAWNGLMISAFCKGGEAARNADYINRAIKSAEFVRSHLIDGSGNLLRSVYAEDKDSSITQLSQPIRGFSSDYSFMIRALLDLYEASFDAQWLSWAKELQQKQIDCFWDTEWGGFFEAPADDPSILLRMKQVQDGAEPSSNSVSSSNLLRLSTFFPMPTWKEKAESIFKLNAEVMTDSPVAVPGMLANYDILSRGSKQIVIIGCKTEQETKDILSVVHSAFLPNRTVIFKDGDDDASVGVMQPLFADLKMVGGHVTAYICENFTCSLPLVAKRQIKEALLKD